MWVSGVTYLLQPSRGFLSFLGSRSTSLTWCIGLWVILKWSEVKVAQSCLTLCDPMDCAVHRIFQAGILEWVVVPFSRGSSQPRNRTQVSQIEGGFFTSWATNYPKTLCLVHLLPINLASLSHWNTTRKCLCCNCSPLFKWQVIIMSPVWSLTQMTTAGDFSQPLTTEIQGQIELFFSFSLQ